MKVIRNGSHKYVKINGATEGLEIYSYYDYHRNQGNFTKTFIVNGVNMYKSFVGDCHLNFLLKQGTNTGYSIEYKIIKNHYILQSKITYSTDLKCGKNIFYHVNGQIHFISYNHKGNSKGYVLEYDDKGRLIKSDIEYNRISFTEYDYIFTVYNYDNIDANYNGYIIVKVDKSDKGRYERFTTKVKLIFNETRDKYKFEFECEEN